MNSTTVRPLRSRVLRVVVPVAALGLALSACGSSSTKTATPAHKSATAPKSTTSTTAMGSSSGSTYAMATVSVAMDKALGTSILVGPNGHTLYLLTVDTPTSSKCTGSCAMIWPPLEVKGMPTVGSGLKASLLGTITRSGGVKQVTYDGHPLYYHDADKAPGQITGEGVGNVWYAVSPSGNPVKGPVTTSSSSTSSSSGYGSGY